ncbi:MAG: DUF1844 domain-containing protein [Planctomycetota bacterium]
MSEEPQRASDLALPGGDFRLFVQKLGYQALIALGVLDNPLTGERQQSPQQARGVLQDLEMLAEKTRGNLDAEEAEHLQAVIESVRRHRTALDDE